MNKKKETRAKLQIIFSVIIFCIVMNAQLYMMINFAEEYLSIAILTVLLLICLYFIVSSIFTFKSLNDQRNEERYDTIFKSEKASYLLLKKYFEEIDSKLDILQSVAKVPTDEIVNTQKGIAKVVINRSRENAEALMNSNDQLLDRITNFEDRIDSNNETLLEGQKNVMNNALTDIVEKQQQLIESIKDMEIRLSQAIANNPVQFNANVEIPAQAMSNMNTIPVQSEPVAVQSENTVPDDSEKQEVSGAADDTGSVQIEMSDSTEETIENVSDEQEAAEEPLDDMSEMIEDIPESAGESVIYSSIIACILASMTSLTTRIVAFDTNIVDLTEKSDDPVDLLFGFQLGGGTDIDRSVAYCEQFITNPSRTLFFIVSDLEEGGNRAALIRRLEELKTSGVTVISLLAISDGGKPYYDPMMAGKVAALGIPCFACSPQKLPQLLEMALKGQDLAKFDGTV